MEWTPCSMDWNLSETFQKFTETRHTDLPKSPVLRIKNSLNKRFYRRKHNRKTRFLREKPPKKRRVKKRRAKKNILIRIYAPCGTQPVFLCQKVQKLNDNRRTKIKCRCDEWGKTREAWLQTAEDIFKRVQASDFLTGRQSNKNNLAGKFWLAFWKRLKLGKGSGGQLWKRERRAGSSERGENRQGWTRCRWVLR